MFSLETLTNLSLPNMMIIGSVLLFGIVTFLLVRALYPEDGLVPLDAIAGIENLFGSTKFTLLSMITASLFLFLPLVFSAVMGAAGVRAVAAAVGLSKALSGGAIQHAAQGPQRIANIGIGRASQ